MTNTLKQNSFQVTDEKGFQSWLNKNNIQYERSEDHYDGCYEINYRITSNLKINSIVPAELQQFITMGSVVFLDNGNNDGTHITVVSKAMITEIILSDQSTDAEIMEAQDQHLDMHCNKMGEMES